MQTFLPYDDFKKSLEALDMRRLGKQRVEAFQILNALNGISKGWINHPATKMWRGYNMALNLYMNYAIEEWVRRGYNNTMKLAAIDYVQLKMPPWFGNKQFHASHRSNLLRKFPEHYGKFGWNEPPDLPYIWPTLGEQ